MHVVDTRDRRTSHADEQITSSEARQTRWAARFDARDEHRAWRREVIPIRLPAREAHRLSCNAEVRSANPAVPHETRRDELRRARRNCKAPPLPTRDDRRVHTDDVAA